MNVLVWVISAALAIAFVAAGSMKLLNTRSKLLENPQMAWANDFSASTVKLIGALEVLGAVGIVLPWLLGIARVLTPLAAVGFALVMVGALITHGRRGELKQVGSINGVLLLLAVVVAVVRFGQL